MKNYKVCQKCETRLSNRSKRTLCKTCLSVCHCGNSKDFRAAECQSCGKSHKALQQWQDQRETITAGIVQAGIERRRRYEDLSDAMKWQVKQDGRAYAYYWTEDGKRRYIYRYQWRWRQANGPIPRGYTIHHKDRNPTNDCLVNLELLHWRSHARLHGERAHVKAESQKVSKICQACGNEFMAEPRKDRPQMYCSLDCYHKAQRSTT